MQWLAGLALFLAVYIPIAAGFIHIPALDPFDREVKMFPIILIALFGVCTG